MEASLREDKLYELIYDELNEFMDNSLCEAISSQVTKKIIKNQIILLSNSHQSKPLETKQSAKEIINQMSNKPSNNNTIIIYTDGSALKNGKPGAKSSSSVYIKELGKFKEIKISKRNENIQFEFNKKNKTKSNNDTMITYACSNIRGEGYAILYAMVVLRAYLIEKIDILKDINKLSDEGFIYPLDSFEFDYISKIRESNKDVYNVYIKTDSEFWIKTINNYIPTWIQKKKVFDMKNIDLVCFIYFNYMCLKKNNINVNLIHVRGHPEKRKSKSQYDEDDIGNTIADEIATNAVLNDNYNAYISME